MEKVLSLSLEESNFTTPPSGPGTQPEVRIRRLFFSSGVLCEFSFPVRLDRHLKVFAAGPHIAQSSRVNLISAKVKSDDLLKLGVRAVASSQSHGTIYDNTPPFRSHSLLTRTWSQSAILYALEEPSLHAAAIKDKSTPALFYAPSKIVYLHSRT